MSSISEKIAEQIPSDFPTYDPDVPIRVHSIRFSSSSTPTIVFEHAPHYSELLYTWKKNPQDNSETYIATDPNGIIRGCVFNPSERIGEEYPFKIRLFVHDPTGLTQLTIHELSSRFVQFGLHPVHLDHEYNKLNENIRWKSASVARSPIWGFILPEVYDRILKAAEEINEDVKDPLLRDYLDRPVVINREV